MNWPWTSLPLGAQSRQKATWKATVVKHQCSHSQQKIGTPPPAPQDPGAHSEGGAQPSRAQGMSGVPQEDSKECV